MTINVALLRCEPDVVCRHIGGVRLVIGWSRGGIYNIDSGQAGMTGEKFLNFEFRTCGELVESISPACNALLALAGRDF